jgi:hypothetical protein
MGESFRSFYTFTKITAMRERTRKKKHAFYSLAERRWLDPAHGSDKSFRSTIGMDEQKKKITSLP